MKDIETGKISTKHRNSLLALFGPVEIKQPDRPTDGAKRKKATVMLPPDDDTDDEVYDETVIVQFPDQKLYDTDERPDDPSKDNEENDEGLGNSSHESITPQDEENVGVILLSAIPHPRTMLL